MIGQIIKVKRLEVGLTQEQLASLVGVRRAAVSRWESGTRDLSLNQFITIARALDCKASDLLKEYENG